MCEVPEQKSRQLGEFVILRYSDIDKENCGSLSTFTSLWCKATYWFSGHGDDTRFIDNILQYLY